VLCPNKGWTVPAGPLSLGEVHNWRRVTVTPDRWQQMKVTPGQDRQDGKAAVRS